jgi:hypothetical protein
MIDPLEQLSRSDKWYLGGAPALVFAPPTPVWLEHPGFWDEAHYLHFPLAPVFTLTLLDELGQSLTLRFERREWRPDRLKQTYLTTGFKLIEHKCCGPDDALVDVVELHNLSSTPRRLQLVAWTVQPVTAETLREAGRAEAGLFLRREVAGLRQTRRDLTLALGLAGARSSSLDLAEPTALQPYYHLTPYEETLPLGGFDGRLRLGGVAADGLLYAALETQLLIPPYGTANAVIAAAVASETASALSAVQGALAGDPLQRSEAAWREYFAGVPVFSCSDPYLESYYWYRWYGLRLNTISVNLGNYQYPAVAEGIGYFRVPISYSAQCHMLETRWQDPTLAQGSLLNFVANQRPDGSLPGHLHLDWVPSEGIYHADWGQRVLDVYAVHEDRAFLETVYPALARYAEYFYRERDREGSGLYDLVNQWESGQEYMSRYVWIDPEGDQWKPLGRRLKGIDASVYMYRLERALAKISRLLDKGEEELWQARAERTKRAILDHCWDEALEAFVDVSPELERSGLVFAASFYPFFADLVSEAHLASLTRHLLNPDEFWSTYPVPTSPKTDPHYSATPHWKGKRTNCPWNGRTWPMTNSHLVEALAHASRLSPALRERTAELLRKFVRMMFFDGDPSRPNCFEHYNPNTGHPSRYRGIDDYQHSWVVDLIIKYAAGLRPELDGVVIDPFPLELTRFTLHGAYVRGRRFDLSFDGDKLAVAVDGIPTEARFIPYDAPVVLAGEA